MDNVRNSAKADREIGDAKTHLQDAMRIFWAISEEKKSSEEIVQCLQGVIGFLSLASDSLESALSFLSTPSEPFEDERDRLADIADYQYDIWASQ